MVSWGSLLPHPWVSGGGAGYSFHLLRLALVAVLLALSPFPVSPGPLLLPIFFPSTFSSYLHGNCTGLSVCACMCAPVYTCIERYICRGQGKVGKG